jgi:predicted phage tail protein
MLREVRLHGHLGARFGRVHRLDVASPAEAVRALCAVLDGFAAYLRTHSEPGYRVIHAGRPVMHTDELQLVRDNAHAIAIVPVIAGGKKGWGRIIAGTLLIIAAGLMPVNLLSVYMIYAGKALLTPQPRGAAPRERPENQPSYFFDGAVNTTAQGQPVPVLFGRLVVGSAVVSAGLTAEDIAVSQPAPPPPAALPPEQPRVPEDDGGLRGGGN